MWPWYVTVTSTGPASSPAGTVTVTVGPWPDVVTCDRPRAPAAGAWRRRISVGGCRHACGRPGCGFWTDMEVGLRLEGSRNLCSPLGELGGVRDRLCPGSTSHDGQRVNRRGRCIDGRGGARSIAAARVRVGDSESVDAPPVRGAGI